jgi:ribosomal protein S12 methylthiotransferase accessory factor
MIANQSALPAPVYFEGRAFRARKHFLGGTHRCAAPEDTLARIQPFLKRAGITRLADISGLDRIGLTTIIAQRPNAPTLSNASGKGFTRVAAIVSAAMEGIELAHAEEMLLPVFMESYRSLAARMPVIDMADLPLSDRSLFHIDRAEPWMIGWDLMAQEAVAVPHAMVGMQTHPEQKPRMSLPFQKGSNGLASGNEFLEAVAAGLYEVIERDALTCQTAAGKYSRSTIRQIDTATVTDPFAADLLRRMTANDVSAVLLEYTVDTEVPVYKAAIFDTHDRHRGVFGGYGAHLDPGIAMTRALTEAAQSRAIYIAGSRDDLLRHDALRLRLSDDSVGIDAFQKSAPSASPSIAISEASGTFEEDIATLLRKLRTAGLTRAIVLDLTQPDIGIPVVRVIVPGLEGYIFKSWAPGRRAEAARRSGIPRTSTLA